MRIQRRWMITAICALAVLANVAGVIAQSDKPKPKDHDVIIERRGGAVIAGGGQKSTGNSWIVTGTATRSSSFRAR